jgi:hypothetical protein
VEAAGRGTTAAVDSCAKRLFFGDSETESHVLEVLVDSGGSCPIFGVIKDKVTTKIILVVWLPMDPKIIFVL